MGLWPWRRKKARPMSQRDISDPTLDPLGLGLSDYDKGADIDPLLRFSDVKLSPEARSLIARAKKNDES